MGVRFYNENKEFVSSVNGTNKTITIPANVYFMKFMVLNTTNYNNDICINVSNTTLNGTYVPHKQQTFLFPLGNEKLMLGDYLADDGIHHVRKQTEITENNINLVYNASSQYGVNCANIRKDALGYKTAWGSRYCLINKYSEISTVQEVRSGTFGTVFDQIYLRIFDDRFTDTETAKQLLIGTIIEILLAEEVIVPYTSAQQEVYNQIKNAYSYDEMTIITGSSDGNKPFFTVQAYKDLNKELNNKVDKVQGKELSSNDFTDVLKEKLEGLENYDDTEIKADISGKQDKTDNNLTTTNKTIVGAINEVDSIAKGANQALSYSNYSAMITAFNSLANNVYNVGQNVMIITLQVPDLWISGIESTSQTYTYTTDEAFTTELNTNGYVQVGYYKLSALETQKVDLTDYATKTYVNNLFNSIVDGDEVSY